MLSFGFRIFCWYRGFCHRTGSDLLLFLLICILKARSYAKGIAKNMITTIGYETVEFIGVLHHMQRYFSHICDDTNVQHTKSLVAC